MFLITAAVSAQTFLDPIRNPGADPHIVTTGGYYYLTNTQGGFISVTRSTTLGGLVNGDTKTVWTDTDPDRNQNVWAPEMHLIDGTCVLAPSQPFNRCFTSFTDSMISLSWYIFYTAGNGDVENGQRSFVIRGAT